MTLHPKAHRRALFGLLTTATATVIAMGLTPPPPAGADALGYLVNVTVRPGYHFTGPDDALRYGNGLCDKMSQGHSYASIVADIKTDLGNDDEYQASYLISQAAEELCPAQIWQLRNSAAGYRPGEGHASQ